MKLNIISLKEGNAKSLELDNDIFGLKPSQDLITQVVTTYSANLRRPVAHTKNRGEVSGGGRKPWRQKGTGNARAGSTRSPLWRGGGVTFGPRNTSNYSKRLNRKMAATALKMVLSAKIAEKKLIVTDSLSVKEISTKKFEKLLFNLPIEEGSILLVLAKTDVNLELSCKNLPYLKTVQVSGLHLIDIINYDYLVTNTDGIKAIENMFKNKEAIKDNIEPKVMKITPRKIEKVVLVKKDVKLKAAKKEIK